MRSKNKVCEMLNIAYTIIQAPMAGGITTPELVASVANSGALGSLAAGYLSPIEMRTAIRKIRTLTDRAFSVNVFIPEKHHATHQQIKKACADIQNSCQELSIKIEPASPPYTPVFEEQMNVVIEENIPIMSFTFGLLDAHWIEKLKNKHVKLIGTATHLAEAQLLENSGIDIIIAQGMEAGGHRGTFLGNAEKKLFLLNDLISRFSNEMKIPVVAAGGIMNSEHLKLAIQLGASGVQMGTAFLTCTESGATSTYKKILLSQTDDQTVLTRAFSGKYARGINNKFIQRMSDKNILDYPIQNALTNLMRKVAKEKGDGDFMSLWAGTGVKHSIETSASELIKKLTSVFYLHPNTSY